MKKLFELKMKQNWETNYNSKRVEKHSKNMWGMAFEGNYRLTINIF